MAPTGGTSIQPIADFVRSIEEFFGPMRPLKVFGPNILSSSSIGDHPNELILYCGGRLPFKDFFYFG